MKNISNNQSVVLSYDKIRLNQTRVTAWMSKLSRTRKLTLTAFCILIASAVTVAMTSERISSQPSEGPYTNYLNSGVSMISMINRAQATTNGRAIEAEYVTQIFAKTPNTFNIKTISGEDIILTTLNANTGKIIESTSQGKTSDAIADGNEFSGISTFESALSEVIAAAELQTNSKVIGIEFEPMTELSEATFKIRLINSSGKALNTRVRAADSDFFLIDVVYP